MVHRKTRCPKCGVFYSNLLEHLHNVHWVASREERQLLSFLSGNRFPGATKSKFYQKSVVRMDRHLTNVHNLTGDERAQLISEAKKNERNIRLRQFKKQQSQSQTIEQLKKKVARLSKEVKRLASLSRGSKNRRKSSGEARGCRTSLKGSEEIGRASCRERV